jgi:di/tricarboxylate transporter
LIIGLVAFVAEWLPVDLTALAIAVALMLLKLISPREGLSGFGDPATLTVMAMFILSSGVVKSGAVVRVRDWLVRLGGRQPSQQLIAMGVVIGPISAFVNNTAVVAIFMPIVEQWRRRLGISPAKLLMPLSFITVLGGMLTLLGTSTNLVASGLSAKFGYGAFSLFQFSGLGLVTLLAGMVVLVLVGPKLLPSREPTSLEAELEEDYQISNYLSEVVVSQTSPLIGQTLNTSLLQREFDVKVLELIRDSSHFSLPLADKTLQTGDILLVYANRQQLLLLREQEGLDLLPEVKFGGAHELERELSSGELGIAEVLILSSSRLVGTTLKELGFRQRYNATVLAIRRGEEILHERLGRVTLRFGDVLLIQGPRQSLRGLRTTRELLVLHQEELDNYRTDKLWIALAIALGVIICASFDGKWVHVWALLGVLLMVATRVLKPGEVYGAVRWYVIVLLAGLFPLGASLEKSGAAQWLADHLSSLGSHLNGFGLLSFLYLITALLSEVLSNPAAVAVMLPIAVKVAKSLNPYALMYLVTFAASNSFLTPIGYQTNTMVYTVGGYRFFDFVRLGLPLTLTMVLITPLAVMLLYGL